MPHTYIVECADGSFYVGSTWDLDRRLWQHNTPDQGPIYTRQRRPVRLAWSAYFGSIEQAFQYEKQVQGWSRKKREALIRGDFEGLPALSRRKRVQEREARADSE
jgi:putative endonuclease